MAKIVTWLMGIWITMFGGGKVVSPLPKVRFEIVTPTAVPTYITQKLAISNKILEKNIGDTAPWGVAKQVDEHTWTMKIGEDAKMGTTNEVLDALNKYRVAKGSQSLTMDKKLSDFAQDRADYLNSIGTTDQHKGFADFLENQDGYNRLGFTWLGENISYGYRLEGVHLIEWLYAGDKPHDDNQLNNRWNYVGIGIKGTATCLIFGTGRR